MHEHYDTERDRRWTCHILRCLIPEVAPPPAEDVTLDRLMEADELAGLLLIEELLDRIRILEAAVVAHRPLCPRCRAILNHLPGQPVPPEAQ